MTSEKLDFLIQLLGYEGSPNWVTGSKLTSQFPTARKRFENLKVSGVYVYQTSPGENKVLSPKPAVIVVEATNELECREIHKKIWNSGSVPFLIVVLPDQIKVYSGFKFGILDKDESISTISEYTRKAIQLGLQSFFAEQIDSGKIWQLESSHINVDRRVDKHLLSNLQKLSFSLVRQKKLQSNIAHSLIGKFIYIRYLYDRNILSEEWLTENGIAIDEVLGPSATTSSLANLVEILESRFNGSVFPLPLAGPDAPASEVISYVSSVFRGDDALSGQLMLDFGVYDFSYIPVELLSSIYEQFLHVEGEGEKVGAFYTPEYLADYLLSEVNFEKPLSLESKILDPSCGSGVFLVLAYRKLIEIAQRNSATGKLKPTELRKILEDSIYGVERNIEACHVTEFGLILTLLSHLDPPDLHFNKSFKFPHLHNRRIFNSDFFDTNSPFWRSKTKFDWIIGNPPWIEIPSNDPTEAIALSWMKKNESRFPVARYRACEAFCWSASDLLRQGGVSGFLIHATTLTNDHSSIFRKAFFKQFDVLKITNFSNLAYILFEGRAEAPAATLIYSLDSGKRKKEIIHYGPFAANQVITRNLPKRSGFSITIYEDEISVISNSDASSGSNKVWKFALWGTYRDKKALARLQTEYTTDLDAMCAARGWNLALGLQLRSTARLKNQKSEAIEFISDLVGKKVFDSKIMARSSFKCHIPSEAFSPGLSKADSHVRKGRRNGLKIIGWIQANCPLVDLIYILTPLRSSMSYASA